MPSTVRGASHAHGQPNRRYRARRHGTDGVRRWRGIRCARLRPAGQGRRRGGLQRHALGRMDLRQQRQQLHHSRFRPDRDIHRRGHQDQVPDRADADYNTYSTLTSIVHLTGYQPGVNSCAIDGDQYNVGCIVQTPNLLIGEHSPTQISIWATNPNETQPVDFDASDPGADKAAMGNFLSGIATLQPSWITFGPDADPVTWGTGPQDLAGPVVRNCDAGDANEQIGGGSTHEESTSVTGTVSVTQG